MYALRRPRGDMDSTESFEEERLLRRSRRGSTQGSAIGSKGHEQGMVQASSCAASSVNYSMFAFPRVSQCRTMRCLVTFPRTQSKVRDIAEIPRGPIPGGAMVSRRRTDFDALQDVSKRGSPRAGLGIFQNPSCMLCRYGSVTKRCSAAAPKFRGLPGDWGEATMRQISLRQCGNPILNSTWPPEGC